MSRRDPKIVAHVFTRNQYSVKYVSQESFKDPETGRPLLNRHGQPEMRDIEEYHTRARQHVRFAISEPGEYGEAQPAVLLSTAEACHKYGRKVVARMKRAYTRLRMAEEGLTRKDARL